MAGSIVRRFLLQGLCFMTAAFGAAFALEAIEGMKIGTTEYYGLMNAGNMYFLLMLFAFGHYVAAFYMLVAFPFSWVMRRWIPIVAVRAMIYTGIGGWGGGWIFHQLYSDYFVTGYDLNQSTSRWLFAIAGLVYALLEYWVWHKPVAVDERNQRNQPVMK